MRLQMRTTLWAAATGSLLAFVAPAMAAVYSPQQVLPAQTIQEFLASPGALLTKYPNGGTDMVKAVQDLAASDPSTLNQLTGLLSKANTDQAKAIGTALGNVAKLAINTDQNYAAQIQVAIALANNDSALVAFNAVVGGDIQLAAIGAGGGGGGGPTSPTGGTGAGGGSNPLNLTTAAANRADTFSPIAFGPGSPGSPTPGPVSPASP